MHCAEFLHLILTKPISFFLLRPTFCSENASEIEDVKNKSAAFRLPARWGNFSLKSHIMKIWPNKTSLAQIIKKIPVINGKNKLKICICDPNVRPCCPQRPLSMVLSRQSGLAKTNWNQTYLDQIVDRERQFCKTFVNAATHSIPLGKSRSTIKDESSTVFTGTFSLPIVVIPSFCGKQTRLMSWPSR